MHTGQAAAFSTSSLTEFQCDYLCTHYCPASLSALLSLQTSQPANVELQWFAVGIVYSAVVSHSHSALRSRNETVTWCPSTTSHSFRAYYAIPQHYTYYASCTLLIITNLI